MEKRIEITGIGGWIMLGLAALGVYQIGSWLFS